jgi:hypothetical protein
MCVVFYFQFSPSTGHGIFGNSILTILSQEQGWLSSSGPPFENIPLQTFEKLRAGVNDSTADFFMWEHFTSKRYYDNGEIKKIGEKYTPWPSWQIVASSQLVQSFESGKDTRLEELFEKIDKGVQYFDKNHAEAVKYISTALDYSEADAKEWLKTVKFAPKTKGVDVGVVEKTVEVLKKAGVLGESGMKPEVMIGKQLGAQLP